MKSAFMPLIVALAACGEPLSLGSDVVWSADHATGDLSQWEADGHGRQEIVGAASALVSAEQLVLTSNTETGESGASLWRDADQRAAYYSARYLVPEQTWTSSAWTILRFASLDPEGTARAGSDLLLRSLPGGGYVLVLFDHNRRYLQAPLPDPPLRVEPGQWFELAVYLRQADDESGAIKVWLDGSLAYDLAHRQTRSGATMRFAVSNIAAALEPSTAVLHVDDVMISLSR
jgi:hypothetical protein